jgi:hypothetical protein
VCLPRLPLLLCCRLMHLNGRRRASMRQPAFIPTYKTVSAAQSPGCKLYPEVFMNGGVPGADITFEPGLWSRSCYCRACAATHTGDWWSCAWVRLCSGYATYARR